MLFRSVGTEIVEHVKRHGCDSLALKMAISDLESPLTSLADSQLLDKPLSQIDQRLFSEHVQTVKFASERVLAKFKVSPGLRDALLSNVLMPSLESRLTLYKDSDH